MCTATGRTICAPPPVSGKKPVLSPSGRTVRTHLSSDDPALVILAYSRLPIGKSARSAGLVQLATKYRISPDLPAKLTKALEKSEKLPSRKGVGGRPTRMTKEVVFR